MTREEWKERLPLIQAFVEGKRIESRPVGYASWHNSVVPDFMLPTHLYRIAPEQKLRPWTADEVPARALYRRKSDKKVGVILGFYDGFVWFIPLRSDAGPVGDFPYTCLQDAEHSTDGGKTWKPCGVLEGEK